MKMFHSLLLVIVEVTLIYGQYPKDLQSLNKDQLEHYHKFIPCDKEKVYKDFFDAFGYMQPTFVRVSCFLCTNDSKVSEVYLANASPDKIDYQNFSKAIEKKGYHRWMYNNLLEVAIMKTELKTSNTINVHFNEDCYYSIHTDVENASNFDMFSTGVFLCQSSCEEKFRWKEETFMSFTVISITVKVYLNGTILIKRSTDPTKLSTAPRENEVNYFAATSCPINNETKMYFKIWTYYIEEKHNPYMYDYFSEHILLPCGPGGYAVDPKTGEFATNSSYDNNTFGNNKTLNEVIKIFYPSPCIKFAPVNNTYDDPERNPGYIDKVGEFKPIEEMGPFEKANCTAGTSDCKSDCCCGPSLDFGSSKINVFLKTMKDLLYN